jgi:hypothetical protein
LGDPRADCSECRLKVAITSRLIRRGGHARQIGRHLEIRGAVMDHKSPIPSKATHKQAEFKQDIVAWSLRFAATAFNEIIRSENENCEIEAINNADECIESPLSEAEHPLAPKSNLTVVIEFYLDCASYRESFN